MNRSWECSLTWLNKGLCKKNKETKKENHTWKLYIHINDMMAIIKCMNLVNLVFILKLEINQISRVPRSNNYREIGNVLAINMLAGQEHWLFTKKIFNSCSELAIRISKFQPDRSRTNKQRSWRLIINN
jgi:hypothetical protein